jgi:hypothetical protein
MALPPASSNGVISRFTPAAVASLFIAPLILPAAPTQAPMASLASAAAPPQDEEEEDMDLIMWIKQSKKT